MIMIVATLALISMTSVNFKGGSPGKFAIELAKATGKSVFIATGQVEKLPSFFIDPKSRDTFDQTINTKTQLNIRPGLDFDFSDNSEYQGLFQRLTTSPAPVPIPNQKLPSGYLKNGFVSISPINGRPYQVSTLINAKWSKKVSAFWLYRPLYVYIQANHVPEREFFSQLAKTVGATLQVTTSGYRLDSDWSSITTMLTKTFDSILKANHGGTVQQKLHRQLFVAMFKAMPSSTVEHLFSAPSSSATYPIPPSSEFANIALNYLKNMGQAESNQRVGGFKSAVGILRRIDPRVPVEYHVDVTGQAFLEVPVIIPAHGRIRFSRSQYINI